MEQPYFPIHPAVDFALSSTRTLDAVHTLDFTVPRPGFSTAQLHVTDVKVGLPVGYQGEVYLTPQGTAFQPSDPAFRGRYFANLFSILHGSIRPGAPGNTAAGPPDTTEIVVDLTTPVQSLVQAHVGETWTIVVALVADTRGTESEETLAARVLPRGSTFSEFLNFAGLNLEIH